jgi:hypothetical protein
MTTLPASFIRCTVLAGTLDAAASGKETFLDHGSERLTVYWQYRWMLSTMQTHIPFASKF